VRKLARVGVTAIAPNDDGCVPGHEETGLKFIAPPVLPARPCNMGPTSPRHIPSDGEMTRYIVRFHGVAVRFEVDGGQPMAVTCEDAAASHFISMETAKLLAGEVFFASPGHVTVEVYKP
jgi:hypothetical protein